MLSYWPLCFIICHLRILFPQRMLLIKQNWLMRLTLLCRMLYIYAMIYQLLLFIFLGKEIFKSSLFRSSSLRLLIWLLRFFVTIFVIQILPAYPSYLSLTSINIPALRMKFSFQTREDSCDRSLPLWRIWESFYI